MPVVVDNSRVPALVQDEALLDDIIDRLLDARQSRPGKQVQLSEQVGAPEAVGPLRFECVLRLSRDLCGLPPERIVAYHACHWS